MAEGLVYKIGADVENLEKAVARVEVLLKDLSKAIGQQTVTAVNTGNKALDSFGQNDSVKQVTEQVNQLSTSADKASTEIDGLSKSIKSVPSVKKDVIPPNLAENVKKTGIELNNLKSGGVSGANALNSISQVARDLPFGFVAIQNNLPQVIDSFSQLAEEAGGVKGAISSISETLTGPEGISFAFGVVITGITVLIQKYGSLGKAFDNFFGDIETATEDQILFNESIAKAAGGIENEKNKIDILVKTITDLKQPQKDRLAAYNELNKIAPDIISNVDKENISNAQSIKLISQQAKIRKDLLQLKITESGINQVLSQNAADLSIANVNLAKATKDVDKALIEFNKSQKNTNVLALQAQQGQSAEALTLLYKRKALEDAKIAVNDLKQIQKDYLSQLDPLIKSISIVNLEVDKNTEKTKKQTEALKYGSKSASNYKYELQSLSEFKLDPEQLDVKNQIERLQELANIVLNVKASEEKRLAALNELKAIEPALFKGLDLQSKNYDKLKASIDVTNEGYLLQLSYLNSIAKASDKIQPQKPVANITPTPAAPIVAPTALPAAIDEFLAKQNQAKDALIEFRKQANLSAAYNLLNDTFFSPIQDLFSNFLENGKFAIADFGKAILKAISQIVAKIIATGIITLLANLFLPGFGAASGGLGKSLLTGIGSALGFNLGGNVAAPSFAGVGGGSLGMSGQVNVVLRGSDLVGSINRTNATINRVG